MSENKKNKKEVELSEADIERLELLQKANEKVGKQLTINSESGNLEEFDELRAIVGKDFENPEEKYNVYYKGIRKLLMDFLPKGKCSLPQIRTVYLSKILLNSLDGTI